MCECRRELCVIVSVGEGHTHKFKHIENKATKILRIEQIERIIVQSERKVCKIYATRQCSAERSVFILLVRCFWVPQFVSQFIGDT